MKLIIAFFLLATTAFATPYVNNTLQADGTLGASPNPSLTTLISDNFSHTVATGTNLWYELVYQGSGTCYVRLMNTSTKSSWVQEYVAPYSNHSYLINGLTKYINYSGCKGSATANSLIHFQ